MFTKHGLMRYSKTMHSHTKTGRGDPVEEKGHQSQAKESETASTSTVGSPSRTSSYTSIRYKQCGSTHTGPLFVVSASVSPYEPCSVEFMGYVLLVSWMPLVPIILPPPGSAWCLAVGLYLCSHQLLDNALCSMNIAEYH